MSAAVAQSLEPVIDSHVHFWDPERFDYPWLEALPRLRHRYTPSDLDDDAAGVPLDAFVFVECNCREEEALDEARTMVDLAGRDARLRAIVAFADLTRPEELDHRLDEYRALGLVRGIRQNIQGQPRGFCLRDTFVDGVREIGRRGFTFDLCATWDQLDEVVELARHCPETRLVLDHCGKPAIGSGALDPWRGRIDALALLPHVYCKLSGLLTETGQGGWAEADLVPYAAHAAATFGPTRLMYGGDWRVLTLAGSYHAWYQFTRRLTGGWDAADRAAFYGGNARDFYGI